VKMKNPKAHEHLTRARTSLLLDHFFFGRLALHLKLVEREDIPTLAVDGKHIYYNPDFVLTLSSDLTKSAIVHEVGHCMFEHVVRRGGRDPKLWNIAGDYAINEIIKTAGFQLGKTWLWDAQYKGMSAEHIYDLLKQDQDKKGGDTPGAGEPGGGLCDIQDGGTSQAEMAEQAMEWKIATAQAAQMAKQHGKIPRGMERFIEEIGTPQVPWREVLQRFITQLAKDDYAWTRPNKKYLSQGLYMPSLYSERMGEIAVVIDTSGSIDQPTLNAFGDEIKAIVAQTRPVKTTVIYCDAAINHVDEFGADDELTFKLHGGGGTSFLPPFLMYEESDEKPVALVYLTDMYGAFPQEAPEYPVLWCATTDVVGPFGETLKIEV
jgi:predicted metal-dependent peptidase